MNYCFVRSPYVFYLLTVGLEGFYFHLITLTAHTTFGRTPLDEGSARHRDLYLTTQTLYRRKTSMSAVGFEHTIQASARPQTYALDRAATGISYCFVNTASSLSQLRHRFSPRAVNVEFVVDSVALGQPVLTARSFYSCQYYSTNIPYPFIHLPQTLYDFRNWQRREIMHFEKYAAWKLSTKS
jgi:hypothetical protein